MYDYHDDTFHWDEKEEEEEVEVIIFHEDDDISSSGSSGDDTPKPSPSGKPKEHNSDTQNSWS
eukprot:CAMPEP_0183736514 /NCGR_PEP_ID=MMETSP0737-20130205/49490_1 /TAXON_ID=385413 /ORGANISM="Thalassiosira miniscula, Strain CCMP1093" /LENGTH=62 /DNA_ID=CAMNT_0025970531 /DNA_START=9 /DNA_END=194 /DNA_ORIENTATION=+